MSFLGVHEGLKPLNLCARTTVKMGVAANAKISDERTNGRSNSVRIHGNLSLPVSAAHDWLGTAHRCTQDPRATNRELPLQRSGALLGADFRNQFRRRRRNRNPDGVPVRNKLVCLLESGRRRYRTTARDGRGILVFPGIDFPRSTSVW